MAQGLGPDAVVGHRQPLSKGNKIQDGARKLKLTRAASRNLAAGHPGHRYRRSTREEVRAPGRNTSGEAEVEGLKGERGGNLRGKPEVLHALPRSLSPGYSSLRRRLQIPLALIQEPQLLPPTVLRRPVCGSLLHSEVSNILGALNPPGYSSSERPGEAVAVEDCSHLTIYPVYS